jgi:NAD(P)-dependent dehydrogenase (short-subunit alcohol dehydrogenase family)
MTADRTAERADAEPAPAPEEARGQAAGRGRLRGRCVLVVGGGQQDHGLDDPPLGNGRAMSVLFAREGASVAISDLDEASAGETAELVRAEGATAEVIVADAADEDAAAATFSRAREALGGLDGVVLNVGIAAGFLLRGTTAEDWDRVMAVNARSQFLGCKHALATMDDGGSVVLIGSVASREVLPFPAYGASKAALESLCRQAAVEGAPKVRVNLLLPGLIDTPLGRLASSLSPLREQVKIPARRQGTAWEIAYGALYLLSDESSYVTGQSLVVDGGLTTAPRA